MKLTYRAMPVGLLLLGAHHEALAGGNMGRIELLSSAERYTTSDQYSRNTFNAGYQHTWQQQRPLTIGVSVAKHQVRQKGTDYKLAEARAKARKKVANNLTLEASVGGVRVDKRNGRPAQSIPSNRLRAEWQPRANTNITVEHAQDALFREEMGLDKSGKVIKTRRTTAEVYSRPHQRVTVAAKVQRKTFSDGNSNKEAYAGVFYGVTPAADPRVWVGVEGTKLKHDRREAAYWSPKTYQYMGVKAHGSMPVNDKLNLTSSISVGRSKDEKSNKYASTFNASVGAKFNVSQNLALNVDLNLGRSKRDQENWKGNGVTAGLVYTF